MSFTCPGRARLAATVVPALAGVLVAGLVGALPAAQAATAATHHLAGVHVTGRVNLAKSSTLFTDSFAEAPDGAVYYSVGSTVREVVGNHAPQPVTAEAKPILALAVNSTDFFVQVGLHVYEYGRKSESFVRQWTLSSPVTPITSAGLIAVGGTVWSWTDWATDFSGFEFATVSKISTSSATPKVLSKENAYAADMAANSTGLYFEAARSNGSNGYLVHVTPSGTVSRHFDANIDAPLALGGGRVDLLSQHANGRTYIDSYRASDLSRVSSVRISGQYLNIAGTSAGLLVVKEPCNGFCPNATVGVLNPANGRVRGAVRVARATTTLLGAAPAVLSDSGGRIYLVRLAG
jgi:hypothetical protein